MRSEHEPVSSFKEFLKELIGTVRTVRYAFSLTDSKDVRPWLYQKYTFAVLMVCLGMVQPRVTALVFQSVLEQSSRRLTTALCALAMLMLVQRGVIFLYWRAHEYLFGNAFRNLNHRIAEQFFEKSPGQHRHIKTLNYESIQKGKNKTSEIYINAIPEFVEAACTILIAYALIWSISPFGGMIIGGAILVHITWSVYLNYRVAVVCTPIEREFSRFERFIAELFRLFERVYVSNKKQFELTRIEDRWGRIAKRDRVFWISHGKHVTGMDALMVVAIITVFFHEGFRAMSGGVGAIALLYPLFAWSTQIYSDIWRIRHIERRVYACVPAIEIMRETLSKPSDVVETGDARILSHNGPLSLSFEGVSYSYPNAADTLSNVSFSVSPGETVALIGPTGSGKSTIEYLAMRFMDPTSGVVRINGCDLSLYRIGSVLDCIGYIPQKPLIFDGTVRDNLLYGIVADGREQWGDARLVELMNDIAIDFGVRPDGENPLDIIVGRDGIQLSGGQAQRLAIGAAVIKHPRLLIVDEATSALDSSTETQVLDGLRKWINGSGMLVIAHRLSTVRDADRIIVLNAGTVEAVGTSFDELVGVSETFRRLITGQDHLLS